MSYETEQHMLALDALRDGDVCEAKNILDDCDDKVSSYVSELLETQDEDDIRHAETMLEESIDGDM